MRKIAVLLAAAALSCKSAPASRTPESAGAGTGPGTPANPPATRVTGAQPAVPNVAGQPATPPESAGQHAQSASAERRPPRPRESISPPWTAA